MSIISQPVYSSKLKTIFGHFLFWCSVYAGYTYMLSFRGHYSKYLLLNLVNVPLYMLAYYLLRHVQIPYLYNQGKSAWFILSLLASSLLLLGIYFLNDVWWIDTLFGKNREIRNISIGECLVRIIRYYSPAMVLLAWESHYKRRKELNRMKELENEKIANELKFLKAQINPHFLFNTLNNLYSYVVNKSPKAPDMIMRLSSILDYVLYKSQKKTVTLSEEVGTIENFLGLEQIRYGDRLEVDFKKEGNMTLPTSPLILLSIVENAFKHGASGDADTPKIKIHIKEEKGMIYCEVWNTKSSYQGELNDAYKEGIGLSNIKRQLNLFYPDAHKLIINNQEKSFNISLTIKPVV